MPPFHLYRLSYRLAPFGTHNIPANKPREGYIDKLNVPSHYTPQHLLSEFEEKEFRERRFIDSQRLLESQRHFEHFFESVAKSDFSSVKRMLEGSENIDIDFKAPGMEWEFEIDLNMAHSDPPTLQPMFLHMHLARRERTLHAKEGRLWGSQNVP